MAAAPSVSRLRCGPWTDVLHSLIALLAIVLARPDRTSAQTSTIFSLVIPLLPGDTAVTDRAIERPQELAAEVIPLRPRERGAVRLLDPQQVLEFHLKPELTLRVAVHDGDRELAVEPEPSLQLPDLLLVAQVALLEPLELLLQCLDLRQFPSHGCCGAHRLGRRDLLLLVLTKISRLRPGQVGDDG